MRQITHAPHPASPRKEAGRGDGEPQFCKNAPEMPSRRWPRSQVGPRPLSPPLCGERVGEGPGDWPHGFKHNRSCRTKAEKLRACDSRESGGSSVRGGRMLRCFPIPAFPLRPVQDRVQTGARRAQVRNGHTQVFDIVSRCRKWAPPQSWRGQTLPPTSKRRVSRLSREKAILDDRFLNAAPISRDTFDGNPIVPTREYETDLAPAYESILGNAALVERFLSLSRPIHAALSCLLEDFPAGR